jgi:hypothetical protein
MLFYTPYTLPSDILLAPLPLFFLSLQLLLPHKITQFIFPLDWSLLLLKQPLLLWSLLMLHSTYSIHPTTTSYL